MRQTAQILIASIVLSFCTAGGSAAEPPAASRVPDNASALPLPAHQTGKHMDAASSGDAPRQPAVSAEHDLPAEARPETPEPAFAEADVFFDPFADNATGPDAAVRADTIPDPLRGYNRAMHAFNDKLYFWVLKPVALGYSVVIYPEIIRVCIKRFFLNAAMPKRFVNCLFQLKMRGAGVELSRFVINTTAGLAGFFDPAKHYLNLQMYDEDTGQTFGYYGMGAGFYFVWPLFGPSSGRDTLGMPLDLALDPASYFPGVSQFRLINNTSLRIGEYEDLKAASLDHYSALRNAYFQYRENAIKR